MRPLLNLLVATVITAVASMSVAAGTAPGAAIVGTVTLTSAEGGTFPGDGARVTLTCAADGTTRTAVADEDGAFRFADLPLDSCSIEADLQGFVGRPVRVVAVANQVVEAYLHLSLASLRVGVNVGGTTSPSGAADAVPRPPATCRPSARAAGERVHAPIRQ
jgi:hypothetical protein